jgi:DNA-binding NarL/FixJ family response regulator
MRLLIVDDSIEMLRILTMYLQADGAHQVVGQALHGRDAVDLALELRPDVVLVDFDMPHMNGLETVRRLKEAIPDLKAIVVSGHDLQEYRRESLLAGADAFVTKRLLEEDLLPRLQSSSAGLGR